MGGKPRTGEGREGVYVKGWDECNIGRGGGESRRLQIEGGRYTCGESEEEGKLERCE